MSVFQSASMSVSHADLTRRPANLHVAATSMASCAPPLRERVEQKFFILPQRESLALALLRRVCRKDPEHPAGQVNSLYFDTPDLDQHERSDSGEPTKDKVRIRWYGGEYDPHRTCRAVDAADDVQVWLELKSRRGFTSTKQRVALAVPATALRFDALKDGIVPATTLAMTMAGFGFFSRALLRPVIVISYWRYRFVEPQTGFRISLDSRIRSSMVMPGIGHGERALELPGAVVEVKGPVFAVPGSLRQIAEIGSSWTRYSKYSSSLDGHAMVPGSVSRLWPSGVMSGGPGVLAAPRRTTETAQPVLASQAFRLAEDRTNLE